MAKNLKIVEWKKVGEFSKKAKTFEDVLDQCASLMDDACTWEIFGTPVFKAEDGKFYTVEIQAKIVEADKDMIDHAGADTDDDWKRNLHPGDEIKIDTGDNEVGPSIKILTIEYKGDTAIIMTTEGEKIECLVKEIC